jgi:hypothetical protein
VASNVYLTLTLDLTRLRCRLAHLVDI